MANEKSKINAELEKCMAKLLKEVMAVPKADKDGKVVEVSLTDKMKVIDRVLKWEAIKSKLGEDEYGSGFDQS